MSFVVSVYLALKQDVLNWVIRKNNFEITHIELGVDFCHIYKYIYFLELNSLWK